MARVNILSTLLFGTAMLALSACGDSAPGDAGTADDYAARIKGEGAELPVPPAGPVEVAPPLTPEQAGTQTAQAVLPPPTVAQPLPASPESASGQAEATNCGANLMSDYIGEEADLDTKVAIKKAASAASEVRFVGPAGETVLPDPSSTRLSIMIDNLGIIREGRCG